MPSNYPGGGPTINVEALLKQPRLIARALTDLSAKRFVADYLFTKGTPDQVAGGAALYQRSESIYPAKDAAEVGPRAGYPRTGWTEAVFAAMVHKYGLEVPITDEAKRRNQMDMVARAQRKIANGLVKFVDTLALDLITTDAAVLTGTTSGAWGTAATDIVKDIATARAAIINTDEGYNPNCMVVNPTQELDLITDADIRDALPREGGGPKPSVVTGQAVPILGLERVISTPQLTVGTILVGEAKMVGTIADEQPGGDEGYSTYQPGTAAEGGAYPAIYAKTYREDGTDETIVRGARFPAMWIAEPTSFIVLSGAGAT